MESKNKKSLMDRATDVAMKISSPLGKLAELPTIASIQNGLVSIMPIIIVGSIFLILYVLGSPGVGTSGKALLPFLTPLADKFSWVNSLTLGFMALYCSISIPASYAEITGKIDVKTASLLGLATFLLFTLSGLDEAGGITVLPFSASGLFVCILTSILSVKIFIFLIDKDIRIKLPSSVPPNIGNAFTALIPYAVCFTIAWAIRTLLNFDMVSWLMAVLAPFIKGSDNVFTAMIITAISNLLWSVGLHGDNMFLTLFTPFGTIWMEENAAALMAGSSVYDLPNVLATLGQSGLMRMTNWSAGVWPLIFFMIRSKVKYLKALGWACLPSAIFTIVEPVVFGLPLALNPFLIVPFLISTVVSVGVGYLMMATQFFGKFFAMIPWATPPFLLGPLGTGDIKTAIIPFVSMLIGTVIYYPFWKQFEKDCLRKEQEQEQLQEI